MLNKTAGQSYVVLGVLGLLQKAYSLGFSARNRREGR